MLGNPVTIPTRILERVNVLEPFRDGMYKAFRWRNRFCLMRGDTLLVLCTPVDGWLVNTRVTNRINAPVEDELVLGKMWTTGKPREEAKREVIAEVLAATN